MNRDKIKEKVITIATNMFRRKIEGVFEATNLVEYFNMVSVDVLEYLLAIESEYDFEFDDDALDEKTLQSGERLLNAIEEQLKA